ncbi:hypothetical protein STCU_00402 [Strigomonas culicis]|nr:hypothetical protein STCU_04986 [Strigomonas culicis]EPY36797.1 hypothetical protein STCU_00402 [Strigomonas culicis]|eukprot:EPY28594.1 hypothetical protein STCU_04986 [Strigomonas culicis]
MHPRSSGQGLFPRYGGGWMHQFGHVYALQQELLNPNAHNWFRAVELWHTARHEGVAMNSQHFTSILRQCVEPAAWEQSLLVLQQMKRENVRPDVVSVACMMAACAEAGRRQEVEQLFEAFEGKMLLDSICYLALIRVRAESGCPREAIAAGKMQEEHNVPFLPNTFELLLEAADDADDALYAEVLARRMRSEHWVPSHKALEHVKKLCARHHMEDQFRPLVEGWEEARQIT